MSNALWFYSDTQQSYGPIDAQQLIAMIQAGQLQAGHFIMPHGGQQWQQLEASPFASYLPSALPPPPVAPPPRQQVKQRVPGQPYRPPQPRVAAAAPQAVKKSYARMLVAALALLAAGVGAYLYWGKAPGRQGFPAATKERPFVNSLGMKFVPVPGTDVLMCIHETRKQDFAAFAAADPRVHDMWKNPIEGNKAVSVGDDHPVAGVYWDDADAFCDWLSKKEGRIYRMPTEHEW